MCICSLVVCRPARGRGHRRRCREGQAPRPRELGSAPSTAAAARGLQGLKERASFSLGDRAEVWSVLDPDHSAGVGGLADASGAVAVPRAGELDEAQLHVRALEPLQRVEGQEPLHRVERRPVHQEASSGVLGELPGVRQAAEHGDDPVVDLDVHPHRADVRVPEVFTEGGVCFGCTECRVPEPFSRSANPLRAGDAWHACRSTRCAPCAAVLRRRFGPWGCVGRDAAFPLLAATLLRPQEVPAERSADVRSDGVLVTHRRRRGRSVRGG
mmetsp:Transcript_21189/g.50579  ORF Transcript_21189/g.50579 Transcript_21189/m.50579 type:complete len:270 (+) Transcript_21189:103-912(+)